MRRLRKQEEKEQLKNMLTQLTQEMRAKYKTAPDITEEALQPHVLASHKPPKVLCNSAIEYNNSLKTLRNSPLDNNSLQQSLEKHGK